MIVVVVYCTRTHCSTGVLQIKALHCFCIEDRIERDYVVHMVVSGRSMRSKQTNPNMKVVTLTHRRQRH